MDLLIKHDIHKMKYNHLYFNLFSKIILKPIIVIMNYQYFIKLSSI